MSVTERTQQLRVVAEILLVHIPELLPKDQPLAHDLLAVAGTALSNIYEDAEQSTKAWDKRANHTKAEELRQEWGWALGAANYATGLALNPAPLTAESIDKLQRLIRPDLEKPPRRQIKDPGNFRGAAQAVTTHQSQHRSIAGNKAPILP